MTDDAKHSRHSRTPLDWMRLVAGAHGIPSPARAVVYAMAFHAGRDNVVTASRSTIAAEAGVSVATVKRTWRIMEEEGWMVRERRQGRTDRIALVPEAWPTSSDQDAGPMCSGGGGTPGRGRERTGGRGSTALRGRPVTPEPVSEPVHEPEMEHTPPACAPETGHPGWARRMAGRGPWTAEDCLRVVRATVDAVMMEDASRTFDGPSAVAVEALAEALGWPDPESLIGEIELVASACHVCPAFDFARLVRGEAAVRGDQVRADNSRSVVRVLAVKHWPLRLRLAGEWRSQVEGCSANGPSDNWSDVLDHLADVVRGSLESGRPLRPVGVPHAEGLALADTSEEHDCRLAALLWSASPSGDLAAWVREHEAGSAVLEGRWSVAWRHVLAEGAVAVAMDLEHHPAPSPDELALALRVRRVHLDDAMEGSEGPIVEHLRRHAAVILHARDPRDMVPAIRQTLSALRA